MRSRAACATTSCGRSHVEGYSAGSGCCSTTATSWCTSSSKSAGATTASSACGPTRPTSPPSSPTPRQRLARVSRGRTSRARAGAPARRASLTPSHAIARRSARRAGAARRSAACGRRRRWTSPVLILGEPGTGRSTLARALHRASARAAAPLVEVDPGTVPATLFESELFGYRAGAFTGADRRSRGPRGARRARHAGARPRRGAAARRAAQAAAAARRAPLRAARRRGARGRRALRRDRQRGRCRARVRQGLFRADLYYRLEVLAFRVPPLRERRGEMPALAAALLADLAARLARPAPPLATGGARVDGGARLAGQPARAAQRPRARAGARRRRRRSTRRRRRPSQAARPRPLAEVEREEIVKALAYTRGHQGKAAALLGISRKALWEKRKRFGIP